MAKTHMLVTHLIDLKVRHDGQLLEDVLLVGLFVGTGVCQAL